jgi:hypothetical protein
MSDGSDRSDWQTFAWDGVRLPVPAAWNLASYRQDRRTFAGVLEDDDAVRLEVEWEHLARPPDLAAAARRLDRRMRRAARMASRTGAVGNVPAGWQAAYYDFAGGRRLVAAVGPVPGANRLALLRFHFDASGAAASESVRRVLGGLRTDEAGGRLWQVYDCRFRVAPEWRLAATELVAGRKHFLFAWRGRLLRLWFFAFADRLLREAAPGAWAAGFLNRHAGLRGPRFAAGPDGGVQAGRSRWLPFGHYDELLRGCRRYRVAVRRLAAKNQLALAVLQHGGAADLRLLADLEHSLADTTC